MPQASPPPLPGSLPHYHSGRASPERYDNRYEQRFSEFFVTTLGIIYTEPQPPLRARANRNAVRLLAEICTADTVYPIIRGVLEASRAQGVCPCPPSNHTSSNPSSSSFVPCSPTGKWIIRLAATGPASPT